MSLKPPSRSRQIGTCVGLLPPTMHQSNGQWQGGNGGGVISLEYISCAARQIFHNASTLLDFALRHTVSVNVLHAQSSQAKIRVTRVLKFWVQSLLMQDLMAGDVPRIGSVPLQTC